MRPGRIKAKGGSRVAVPCYLTRNRRLRAPGKMITS